MNHRLEFKYVVDRQTGFLIENFVKKLKIRTDKHWPAGRYVVTTLYFDTPNLEDFFDKLGGFKDRQKIRARAYSSRFAGEEGDKGDIWFEVKEKHDMNIMKRRILTQNDRQADIKDLFNRGSDTKGLPDDFRFPVLLGRYKPHLIVRYKRTAYEDNFYSRVRITFDTDIEACGAGNFMRYSPMSRVLKDLMVLEIKFEKALPWWFRELAQRFELSRTAFSKYSNAVDALNRLNPYPR